MLKTRVITAIIVAPLALAAASANGATMIAVITRVFNIDRPSPR